jgi:3,4-dihydroxy 2-butanone 4-phosphate synthase/GTP cyclohydrolase II
MFELINKEGKGVMVFINQQNKPTSTLNRLRILKKNQTSGKVIKAPKIEMDNRDFGIGAQILHDLNIHKLKLISNSTAKKRVGIIGYGLEIVDYVTY